MKITKIEAIPLKFSMDKPIWDAQHYIPARQTLLVKVQTDEGIIGWGESASFGGPMITTKTVIEEELAPYFLGESPFSIERLWDKVYKGTIQHGRKGIIIAALSGIDIAIWDIIGKASGKPLYQLLGGYRDQVEAYASSGFYSEEKNIFRLCQEMEHYVSEGFKTVKMKVGGLTPEQDLERIRAVRKTVGSRVNMAVDANSNWDVPTAKWMTRQIEELSIRWLEEPVLPDDVQGSAEVARQTIIPIAGYEQEVTRYGFKSLIDQKAVHIVQPDVIWSGGITECKKIAALAAASHLPCIPHVFSSGVCLAANLHFIASIPNGSLLELDRNENPLRDLLINEALLPDKNAVVHLPQAPGLGIEINLEIVEKYRMN